VWIQVTTLNTGYSNLVDDYIDSEET